MRGGLRGGTWDRGGEEEGWGGGGPRYARVVYLAAPAARATVERARASLADRAAWRGEGRGLPAGALWCGAGGRASTPGGSPCGGWRGGGGSWADAAPRGAGGLWR